MALRLKKLVLLSGHHSVTDSLFGYESSFIDSLVDGGKTEILRYDIANKRIGACKRCDGCFIHENACAFYDDFNELARLLLIGDSLVGFLKEGDDSLLSNLFSKGYAFHGNGLKPRLRKALLFYEGSDESFLLLKKKWDGFIVDLEIPDHREILLEATSQKEVQELSLTI